MPEKEKFEHHLWAPFRHTFVHSAAGNYNGACIPFTGDGSDCNGKPVPLGAGNARDTFKSYYNNFPAMLRRTMHSRMPPKAHVGNGQNSQLSSRDSRELVLPSPRAATEATLKRAASSEARFTSRGMVWELPEMKYFQRAVRSPRCLSPDPQRTWEALALGSSTRELSAPSGVGKRCVNNGYPEKRVGHSMQTVNARRENLEALVVKQAAKLNRRHPSSSSMGGYSTSATLCSEADGWALGAHRLRSWSSATEAPQLPPQGETWVVPRELLSAQEQALAPLASDELPQRSPRTPRTPPSPRTPRTSENPRTLTTELLQWRSGGTAALLHPSNLLLHMCEVPVSPRCASAQCTTEDIQNSIRQEEECLTTSRSASTTTPSTARDVITPPALQRRVMDYTKCPQCLTVNLMGREFCARCKKPLRRRARPKPKARP